MQIHVPENVGGELRVLPEDTYTAVIDKFIYKTSKSSQQPKLIGRFIIKSEYTGKHKKDYVSTVGEMVLEDFSLQPQAIFKLNDLFKKITKERIPIGDYDEQSFCEMINDRLAGTELKIDVYTDNYTGTERSKIRTIELV